jgi:hypothetical protein
MRRPAPLVVIAALVIALIGGGAYAIAHRPFPPDTTPEGAWSRIALAVADGHARDAFAYLETEAQWASYTIRDARKKATERVAASYPLAERDAAAAPWAAEAKAPDGADVFALYAVRRGWMGRLERDLSGASHVDVQGDRATVVTARGTRYSFRRRENGIWGLTLYTAELMAEAERATHDLAIVEAAANDYDKAKDKR